MSKDTGFWKGLKCHLFHRTKYIQIDRVLAKRVVFTTCRKCGYKQAVWIPQEFRGTDQ